MTTTAAVELPWRRGLHPVYALSLLGFVAVLLSIASRDGQFQPVHRATMAAGACLFAYSLAAQLVNSTRLSIEQGTLRVEHGPLPWRGATVVPVSEIRSLRCEPHSRRLVLHTAVGEEFVLGENLPADALGAIDGAIRDRLGLGAVA